VKDFSLKSGLQQYVTNFGDPSKPPHSTSEYARLVIDVEIERESSAVFWKLTAIPYATAILAFLSFFVVFDSFLMFPRFSLLIGSLFAACLSMRSTNSELGTADVFTLLDSIHVATLVYIFFGIIFTIVSRAMFHLQVAEKKILFWNIVTGVASIGIYALVNLALVWSAVRHG
jgi:hypothetical protein